MMFNETGIERLNNKLRLLYAGKTLTMEHYGYKCVYNFKMNPQRNRLYVEYVEGCKQEYIENHPHEWILMDFGDWYVQTEEPVYEMKKVLVIPGIVEKI